MKNTIGRNRMVRSSVMRGRRAGGLSTVPCCSDVVARRACRATCQTRDFRETQRTQNTCSISFRRSVLSSSVALAWLLPCATLLLVLLPHVSQPFKALSISLLGLCTVPLAHRAVHRPSPTGSPVLLHPRSLGATFSTSGSSRVESRSLSLLHRSSSAPENIFYSGLLSTISFFTV